MEICVLLPIILLIFHYLFLTVHNNAECVSHQDSQLRSWPCCEQTWGTGRAVLLPCSLGTLTFKAEQENQLAKTRHDSTASEKERASVLHGDAIEMAYPGLAAGSLAAVKRLVAVYWSRHSISGLLADFFAYAEARKEFREVFKSLMLSMSNCFLYSSSQNHQGIGCLVPPNFLQTPEAV